MDEKQKTKPKAAEWPNPIRTREELDAALEAGLKSGVVDENIKESAAAAISRLKADGRL